ncbi:MAG: chitobiase/beta-hexosaminidase C-terminal domain-containing protein [Chloroflexi bacterium]|nr:chitobiase/beta-hexosaminidase C-terminal domain-containing protein [Chloroflexota bacterium]
MATLIRPTSTLIPATPTATPRPAEQLPTPIMVPLEEPLIGPQTVDFFIEHGSQVRYTLDGSAPTATTGLVYGGSFELSESVTIKAIAVLDGWLDSDVVEYELNIYSSFVENTEPLQLSGDDVLEIADTYYIMANDILLSDNATLIIRDSTLFYKEDHAFQYGLTATGNSKVIFSDSRLFTACTGSLNWHIADDAVMNASNIVMPTCNIWTLVSGHGTANVDNWDLYGGTTCDNATLDISNSRDMELELCFPQNAVVDAVLPTEIDEFVIPQPIDQNVNFTVRVTDSTVDGWGVGVPPGSDITIRDTPAVTISVTMGFPWTGETVVLDGLAKKLYEDQTWEIVDAKLRLVNTRTYGWEPNVFGNDNTMIIRNSDYSGNSVNSSNGKYVVENSTTGLMMSFESVEMTISGSTIIGDVIASQNSVITLVDSVVGRPQRPDEDDPVPYGNVIARDNGTVILINTRVWGEIREQGDGKVVVADQAAP